jgi:hypothetical protein
LFLDCSANPVSQFVFRRFIAPDEIGTLAPLEAGWFK